MMHFIWQVCGWIVIVTVLTLVAMNGFLMLAMPQVWFRLPPWLAGRPAYMTEDYTKGWDSLYVRIIGAALLGGISWMVCTSIFSN
jgi:hypothetical protein